MSQLLESYLEKIGLNILGDELTLVYSYFKKKLKKQNEFIHEPNKICNDIYFINKGSLRGFSVENEKESTRYIAFEGSAITDLISFTQQLPSTEFIQATEDVELLCISYQNFQKLYTSIPALRESYINRLEIAYSQNIRRLETFITMNAKERFHFLMETEPQIIHRISNKIVANYLGITPESLSRLKNKKN